MPEDVTHGQIISELRAAIREVERTLLNKIDLNHTDARQMVKDIHLRINAGDVRMNAIELEQRGTQGKFDLVDEKLTRLIRMQEEDVAERKERQDELRQEAAFRKRVMIAVAIGAPALTAVLAKFWPMIAG